MTFRDLLTKMRVLASDSSADPVITAVSCDSRTVVPGTLYVSIPGFKVHGDTFIKQAMNNGACAIVSENRQDGCNVPWIQVENTRKWLGTLSRLVLAIDIDAMTLVGITGTNGKTTTAHLFRSLFLEHYAAEHVWMYGTINNLVEGLSVPAHNTTPQAAEIFESIAKAEKKPRAMVMEVSSHSLALDRVEGLLYDCAVFTNLTQDHLDFHKTMESYYQAKKLLFTNHLKTRGKAVINIDDPYGLRLAQELDKNNVVTFGKHTDADVRIMNWECNWDKTAISLSIKNKTHEFNSRLAGFFNVYNMTTMVAGAYSLGISMDTVASCFAKIATVPGRMEKVVIDAPFSVFVDYAHTPDALENVLTTARKLTRGRLLCVFGCGGDRDRTKRPLMADAVARLADEGFVTSDNPRTEDPQSILNEVQKGIPLDFPHQVIVDRKEAIQKALSGARAKDCIVIAGKGHEDYQEINGVRHHFDDREEVKNAYAEMVKNGC